MDKQAAQFAILLLQKLAANGLVQQLEIPAFNQAMAALNAAVNPPPKEEKTNGPE